MGRDIMRVIQIEDALKHEGVARGVARRFSVAHVERWERFERHMKRQAEKYPRNHKAWVRWTDRLRHTIHKLDLSLVCSKTNVERHDGKCYDARTFRYMMPLDNQRGRCMQLICTEPKSGMSPAIYDGNLIITKHAVERMVQRLRLQHTFDLNLMLALLFDDYLTFRREVWAKANKVAHDTYPDDPDFANRQSEAGFVFMFQQQPEYSMLMEGSEDGRRPTAEFRCVADIEDDGTITHSLVTVVTDGVSFPNRPHSHGQGVTLENAAQRRTASRILELTP